jgi:hypothetical protein
MRRALGKEKGPFDTERPKSREETPKEGYDRASLARECLTAKISVATHNLQLHFLQPCKNPTEGLVASIAEMLTLR